MKNIPNHQILITLFKRYKLTNNEQEELLAIIINIYVHDEFQRRLTNEFPHHGKTTLGEHILKVTIVTYKHLKKRPKKKAKLDIAVKIAMLHDLYTLPWQDSPIKDKRFINKHGFRHPIEAVVNSSIWFPELFEKEEEAKMIIDGIIHHMYPFPSIKYIDSLDNLMELRNFELVENINENIKKLIINSSKRGRLKSISFKPSKYSEGKIVCYADTIASLADFKKLNDVKALVGIRGKKIRIKKKDK